jgi:hypothetical protein
MACGCRGRPPKPSCPYVVIEVLTIDVSVYQPTGPVSCLRPVSTGVGHPNQVVTLVAFALKKMI